MSAKEIFFGAVLGLSAVGCSRPPAEKAAVPAEPVAAPPPASAPAAEHPQGPRVAVHLRNGKVLTGIIVASSTNDITLDGDDGVETRIPAQVVGSIDYNPAKPKTPRVARAESKNADAGKASTPPAQQAQQPSDSPSVSESEIPSRTLELPVGSEVSVRLNESIDSKTAQPGQTFDASVTRSARDTVGDVVIPKGSLGRIVIRSASKGDRFHGASDLVFHMQSVSINGRRYKIDTADIIKRAKDGVGLNRRTAKYAGGVAALGAVIGAIAGGGKGAAIGAGAGAGAGVLGEVLTKGGSLKVPAETVLTFRLDQPLYVEVMQ